MKNRIKNISKVTHMLSFIVAGVFLSAAFAASLFIAYHDPETSQIMTLAAAFPAALGASGFSRENIRAYWTNMILSKIFNKYYLFN